MGNVIEGKKPAIAEADIGAGMEEGRFLCCIRGPHNTKWKVLLGYLEEGTSPSGQGWMGCVYIHTHAGKDPTGITAEHTSLVQTLLHKARPHHWITFCG